MTNRVSLNWNKAVKCCKLTVLSPVILLIAGCGGGGNSVVTPAIPIPTNLTASAVASNGLTGTLSQPAGTVSTSGSLQYTLTLTNTTSQPVVIRTFSVAGQAPMIQVGLEVKDPMGSLIYPGPNVSGNGDEIGPIKEVDATLQPGQAMSHTVQVSGFKAKGLYTASAGFVAGAGSASGITADAGPLTVLAQ